MSGETRDRILALTSWHHDWSGLRVAVLGLGVALGPLCLWRMRV